LTVLDKLSSAVGRRDEGPNQELAAEIAAAADGKSVRELVDNLANADKRIQSDCIKVLYEIGYRKPELIAPYSEEFGKLLVSKNNRLVWGGMIALDSIASVNQRRVHGLLDRIVQSANSGSVITRDHAVGILAKLARNKDYSETCFPLLLQQLRDSPNNQFPSYVEMSVPVVGRENGAEFTKLVEMRLGSLEKESQRKRVEKALRALRVADP
jgi:hypothetical protein